MSDSTKISEELKQRQVHFAKGMVPEIHPHCVNGRKIVANFMELYGVQSVAFLGVGGTGAEAVQILSRYPDVRSVVAVDGVWNSDEETQEVQQRIAEQVSGGQVTVINSDFTAVNFCNGDVELVVMGFCLHDNSQASQHELLERCFNSGVNRIALLDVFLEGGQPNYGYHHLMDCPQMIKRQLRVFYHEWRDALKKEMEALNLFDNHQELYGAYAEKLEEAQMKAMEDNSFEQFETVESAKEKFALHGYQLTGFHSVPGSKFVKVLFFTDIDTLDF